MSWNPELYLNFADHRTRPAHDLLTRVSLTSPRQVADLGCGPGNSTRLLAARWPEAEVTGIDNSAAMLAKARASEVGASWVEADIATWRPDRRFDLLYANAALQWLDDHAALLPRLLEHVEPGGVLAVQMPRNWNATAYQLMREVARCGPWADQVADVLRAESVGPPDFYNDLLAPRCRSLDIWETDYLHVLDGADPVLDWTRSTAMRPIAEALCADQLVAFEAEYAARLRQAYPKRADGHTLFPFRRLFVVAQMR